MSQDQRFHWIEPFSFARARARSVTGGNKLLLAIILAGLLAVGLVVVVPLSTGRDFVLAALFAVSAALLVAYPGMWLFSRIPNSVLVATDRIVVGRKVTKLAQVQSADVGTARMGGRVHLVFTFRTKDGREYLYGLGSKIDSKQLAVLLQQVGVREPQA